MNLIFICSSLERGRDGVGDYTRQLSYKLAKQGHQVSIISIYDRHLSHILEKSNEDDGLTEIKILRLSSRLSWKDRAIEALAFVNAINPEWISLQFVPFGFQDKGLPIRLCSFLKRLSTGKKWHIMFHELWVGMEEETSIKRRIWGWLQKQLIKLLIRKLKPAIIHTQSLLYQLQLNKLGVEADYLPLFGNVPISIIQDAKIPDVNGVNYSSVSAKGLSFVIFGGIHHGSPIKHFVEEVFEYGRDSNLPIKLTLIGRCGSEQINWMSIWQSAGLEVSVLGEQSLEYISQVLSASSIGIVTTPFFLTDKSGSAAAMKEHGLPVICVSRSWHPRGITRLIEVSGFLEYQRGNFQMLMSQLSNTFEGNRSESIVDQFINNFLAKS